MGTKGNRIWSKLLIFFDNIGDLGRHEATGGTLGAELVTGGDMNTPGDWTTVGGTVTGGAFVTDGVTATPRVEQSVDVSSGDDVLVTFDATTSGVQTVYIKLDSLGNLYSELINNTSKTVSVVVTAEAAATGLQIIFTGGAAGVITVDNISAKKLEPAP